ncbi:MAG: penicillin-binding protein 2 [Holosporales bacterium]|nr:penicillin-binding protein 2 [Holosporales bacterium]
MKSFVQKSFKKLSRHISIWHELLHYNNVTSIATGRILFLSSCFCFCFVLIGARLIDLMVLSRITVSKEWNIRANAFDCGIPRADIIDRNGLVLATHLVTASVYVNTNDIQDINESVYKLHSVLTNLATDEIRKKLNSGKSFLWLCRHLSPKKQELIQRLGLPGVYLKKDYKRVYPFGNLAGHVIGFCDIDGNGLAGVEKYFDSRLSTSNEPLQLSIDVKIQHIIRELLFSATKEFDASGGNVIVMNAKTGEIIAIESVPCVDINQPSKATQDELFNRNTLGVYEMGSVFKVLNMAIALESGKITKHCLFDATNPIKIGHFLVTDFRGQNRPLTFEEAFIYSSNIAAVKIAQQFGGAIIQRKYFEHFGVFRPIRLELPEFGRPIYPKRWTDSVMMSSAYGYGVAVSPISLISIVNGLTSGIFVPPTLLHQKAPEQTRFISSSSAKEIRHLMRKVVCEGTAKKANVKGCRVFAKTGTAYKNKHGKYDAHGSRRTIFIGGFPEEDPQYIVLFMLDDPNASTSTFGFATAGWNVVPYGGRMIERIAPLLGVLMSEEEETKTIAKTNCAVKVVNKPQNTTLATVDKSRKSQYDSIEQLFAHR